MANTYAREEEHLFTSRFWEQASAARPQFGFHVSFSEGEELAEGRMSPDDISWKSFPSVTEERYSLMEKVRQNGLWAAEVKPGFPWIPAMLGCDIIRRKDGYQISFDGKTIDEVAKKQFNPREPWTVLYFSLIESLTAQAGSRYPVAFPNFPGGLETLASILGEKETRQKISSNFEETYDLVRLINDLIFDLTCEAGRRADFFRGGSVISNYSLWCPGSCFVYTDSGFRISSSLTLREAKRILRKGAIFKKSFIEIESGSVRGAEPFLGTPGLHGFIVSVEEKGPPLVDLLPFLREIQKRKKLLVLSCPPDPIDLDIIADELSSEGLYVCLQVGTYQEAAFWSRYLVKENLLFCSNAGTGALAADLTGCS